MRPLSEKERDALLYPSGKHDYRTLLALSRKGLVRVWRIPNRYGRRHELTIAGQAWVEQYRTGVH
jgi:hypothetical protein